MTIIIVAKYASSNERLYAFLIDVIFVSGLSFITGIICSILGVFINYIAYPFFMNWFCVIPAIIVAWLYFAIMESSKKQATLGKMLFGLKITNLNYKRITFWNATQRLLLKVLSINLKLNNKGQALHDKLSKTLVVKE